MALAPRKGSGEGGRRVRVQVGLELYRTSQKTSAGPRGAERSGCPLGEAHVLQGPPLCSVGSLGNARRVTGYHGGELGCQEEC